MIFSALALDFLFPICYRDEVFEYSNRFGVEQSLVFSVIDCESGGRADCVSPRGAVGLMQLTPTTAEWLCKKLGEEYSYQKLYEPDFNVMLGTFYLAYLSQRFEGDFVLAAYNAGEGVTKNRFLKNGVIDYPETENYVLKVKRAKSVYSVRLSLAKALRFAF